MSTQPSLDELRSKLDNEGHVRRLKNKKVATGDAELIELWRASAGTSWDNFTPQWQRYLFAYGRACMARGRGEQ